MNNSSAYRFTLSPAELHWLCGSFGYMQLPLPADTFAKLTFNEKEAELRSAQDLLQRRGLIQRVPGQGWQVDRVPAAAVRMLGSGANRFNFEMIKRSGATRHAQIVADTDIYMRVTLEDDSYHFLFSADKAPLVDELLNWLGASTPHPQPAFTAYTLPQPMTFLPIAWTDPALATKILKTHGQKTKEIKTALAWAETLDWVAQIQQGSFEVLPRFLRAETTTICGQEKTWKHQHKPHFFLQ